MRGQSSVHTRRASKTRYLIPCRPSEQRAEKRPRLSCLPLKWLAEPKTAKRTEERGAPSPVVPATKVAGCAHDDQANCGQTTAVNCRACHHGGWLSQRLTNEQKSQQRPHLSCPPNQRLAGPTHTQRTDARTAHSLSCPPTQWLVEPRPNRRSEERAAPSPVVHTTTVAG
jgi:hypothetical protein